MPLQATSGAASQDGFGGNGVPVVTNYIEDVFSTYLYTGNGSTQTITNGIDLSTNGGMVWSKRRDAVGNHFIQDTVRTSSYYVESNTTSAQVSTTGVTFSTTGYSMSAFADMNVSGRSYASWTFRKQPKFFDIVTYTGTGTNTAVPHNLGSTPGCVIVKATGVSGDWGVWHRGTGAANAAILGISLNTTNGAASTTGSQSYATSTTFDYQGVYDYTGSTALNVSGRQYVAYLFAHDAGGFGLTGTDNVISCGSYTGNALENGPIVTLGYEPQWVMIKRVTGGTNKWVMIDNMRRFVVTPSNSSRLYANLTNAEETNVGIQPLATGFQPIDSDSDINATGQTYIYIAIRRGPMKVPTDGTKVFAPVSTASATDPLSVTTNFPVDLSILRYGPSSSQNYTFDRLRGASSTSGVFLKTNDTSAETTANTYTVGVQSNTSVIDYGFLAGNSTAKIYWNFQRAPSFFDEVCYTGTGVRPLQLNHNLGAVPELMIVKNRTNAYDWFVYSAALGNNSYLRLNTTAAVATSSSAWSDTTPTSTTFTVGDFDNVNGSTNFKYVAYLFATCAGVSKVGSYTGTGTTLQVDCGFTGGARFVLIKRTDSTGDWYVWDSARGIVSGNDPYLLLNSTAVEVTSTDYIDTYSAGFEISSTAPSAINASGGTFIFLAIA